MSTFYLLQHPHVCILPRPLQAAVMPNPLKNLPYPDLARFLQFTNTIINTQVAHVTCDSETYSRSTSPYHFTDGGIYTSHTFNGHRRNVLTVGTHIYIASYKPGGRFGGARCFDTHRRMRATWHIVKATPYSTSVLRPHGSTVPLSAPIKLPIPNRNPNTKTHPNHNPIFKPNPNPFLGKKIKTTPEYRSTYSYIHNLFY